MRDLNKTSTATRLLQKVGAEMIGTFALVFAGCGAMMVDATGAGIGHTGVCLTFGLVVTAMIYATGHVSGAHFNPAVTLAFASVGSFPWRQVPAYISGQCAAALVAAWLLSVVLGPVGLVGATVPAGTIAQSLVLEVVLTFFLMFVITAVATDARVVGGVAGAAIGATVTLCALMGGPISGASMNPARSLGPALISGATESLWLYGVGPIVGALLGAWAYRLVCCSGEQGQDAAGCC
jgi:aquaporin NIP